MDYWGEIGGASGVLYTSLTSEEGPATISKAKKKTQLDDELLLMAIGWLAREDKIEIVKNKRGLKISLK
ncbi:winged helix-turn-helix domain-containing protein [Candidatus Altiarchaeota archaeon]